MRPLDTPGLPQPYKVFFGSFAPWQGISTLLRASSGWPEDLPLVVVGDGALRSEVERAALPLRRSRRRGLCNMHLAKKVVYKRSSARSRFTPREGYGRWKLCHA